jgi:predicted TIM-barrel fold metal-dependent hydrolase
MDQVSDLVRQREASERTDTTKPFDYKIVDADAHVSTPPDFWADYLPDRLKHMSPHVEEGDEFDYIVFQGNKRKLNLLSSAGGRATGKEMKVEGKISDIGLGGYQPATRIADMDHDGMDAAVLFGGGPLGTTDTDLYIESFRAYNRWLAEFCDYDRRRLIGIGYIPLRDVDESIAMMKECKALGFNTVNIPAFPQDRENPASAGPATAHGAQALALSGNPNGDRQYNQPEFDRFWAAACDMDMTLSIHLGARMVRFGNKQHFLPDLLMSKFSMAEPIAIMIFGGVFDRFPKLRFTSVESGVGWFAFAAEYMDRTWEKQRFWTECPSKERPSFYMDQNVYGSFINDRTGVLCRDLPGAKNIMWSSDYPHSETTFPNSAKVIARDFKGIPEADRYEIICGRAKKLFKVGE